MPFAERLPIRGTGITPHGAPSGAKTSIRLAVVTNRMPALSTAMPSGPSAVSTRESVILPEAKP